MRITNSMMRNNVLMALNQREQAISKLDTQIHSTKKIQKPSDDPVIAARILKFRTTLSEIEQYKRNADDAESWLENTEQAVKNVIDRLKRMKDLSNKGANGPLNLDDRKTIIAEFKQIKAQLATEGNAAYAGRYLFSGYKTNKSPLLDEPMNVNYEIRETFDKDQIETVGRYFDKKINQVHRIKLGYDNLGAIQTTNTGLVIATKTSADVDAYKTIAGTAHYLEDTGELIINDADIAGLTSPVQVSYQKNQFIKGDVRPELYFESTDLTTGQVFSPKTEEMEYQVSYSQLFTVNLMGNQLVTKTLIQDINNIIHLTESIGDEVNLENDLKKSQLTKEFSKLGDILSGHLEPAVNMQADIGAKINSLMLIEKRLDDDKLNFESLLSKTEDTNIPEALTEMTAQKAAYSLALHSGSQIVQPTLLDFIR